MFHFIKCKNEGRDVLRNYENLIVLSSIFLILSKNNSQGKKSIYLEN